MSIHEYEQKRDELVLQYSKNIITWEEYLVLMNELERKWEESR